MPERLDDFVERLADLLIAWGDEEGLWLAPPVGDQRAALEALLEEALLLSGRG